MFDSSSAAAWTEVLAQVEDALAQAGQAAAAREHALADESRPVTNLPPPSGCEAVLRRVAERRVALELGVARAGRHCGQVEAVLQAEEETVRDWCRRAGAAGEKLANWAGRPV